MNKKEFWSLYDRISVLYFEIYCSYQDYYYKKGVK